MVLRIRKVLLDRCWIHWKVRLNQKFILFVRVNSKKKFVSVINGTHPTLRSDPYSPGAVIRALNNLGWVIPPEDQDCHELLHVLLTSLEEEAVRPKKVKWSTTLVKNESTNWNFYSISDRLPVWRFRRRYEHTNIVNGSTPAIIGNAIRFSEIRIRRNDQHYASGSIRSPHTRFTAFGVHRRWTTRRSDARSSHSVTDDNAGIPKESRTEFT